MTDTHGLELDGNFVSAAAANAYNNWRRRDCVVCNERVVRNRDAWIEAVGTRDGAWLSFFGMNPGLVNATDPDRRPDAPIYFLGTAHQRCQPKLLGALRGGDIELPEVLPRCHMAHGEEVLEEVPYRLHLPATLDRCPFCDSDQDLTEEHIWPLWYSRFIINDLKGTMRANGKSVTRIDLTVPVCGECNNNWLSVLENDSSGPLREMLRANFSRPGLLRLDAQHQALLATWAVKTAFLIDLFDEPAVVPRGFLQQVEQRRKPPRSAVVWVANCEFDAPLKYEKLPLCNPPDSPPQGIVITFKVLNLLFQVFCHFNSGTMNLPDQRRHTEVGQAMLRVWPPASDDAYWPPLGKLGIDSWDQVHRTAGL